MVQPYSLLLITLVALEQSSAEFLNCANGHKQEQTKQKEHLPGEPSCSQSTHCHSAASVLWYTGQAISFLKQANIPTIFSDLFSGAENLKTAMLSWSFWSATFVTHWHKPSPGLPTYVTLPLGWDLCPQPSPSIINNC